MSLRYLAEHAQPVLLALDLARKEAEHLRYSQTTLFALPIDLAWVQSLGEQPALAEKVEAFVSRSGLEVIKNVQAECVRLELPTGEFTTQRPATLQSLDRVPQALEGGSRNV